MRCRRDGRTAALSVIASGLDTPNGVAFREGALYVAEVGRILRFDGIEDRLDNPIAHATSTFMVNATRKIGANLREKKS